MHLVRTAARFHHKSQCADETCCHNVHDAVWARCLYFPRQRVPAAQDQPTTYSSLAWWPSFGTLGGWEIVRLWVSESYHLIIHGWNINGVPLARAGNFIGRRPWPLDFSNGFALLYSGTQVLPWGCSSLSVLISPEG